MNQRWFLLGHDLRPATFKLGTSWFKLVWGLNLSFLLESQTKNHFTTLLFGIKRQRYNAFFMFDTSEDNHTHTARVCVWLSWKQQRDIVHPLTRFSAPEN